MLWIHQAVEYHLFYSCMYLHQYAVSDVYIQIDVVRNLFCKRDVTHRIHLLQWGNLAQTPPTKEGWYKLRKHEFS